MLRLTWRDAGRPTPATRFCWRWFVSVDGPATTTDRPIMAHGETVKPHRRLSHRAGLGQHGQGVLECAAARRQRGIRVGRDLAQRLHPTLPQRLDVVRAGPAPEPATHGGLGAFHSRGDPPEPQATCLVRQRCPDHPGGVGTARLQRRGQQDLGGPALAAARSPWRTVTVSVPSARTVRSFPYPNGQVCPCNSGSAARFGRGSARRRRGRG